MEWPYPTQADSRLDPDFRVHAGKFSAVPVRQAPTARRGRQGRLRGAVTLRFADWSRFVQNQSSGAIMRQSGPALAGRGARAAELSSTEDEKDLLVRPLGRARGGSPGLALGFRNAMFPSCWRLSPLFYQGGQIFIFPAPLSFLGEGCISQLIVFQQARATRRCLRRPFSSSWDS